ncbi:MAG: 5-oxoprolinase/urea amidolyase family protein [Methylophaga sp.]|nr:5-oxoprolinase/urea amidolyase family protein [Methylophaga sp.]
MSFDVIKSGFFSLIEDYGRFGFARYGLSQSGVADEHAYCWANHLLDNHFNDAVLEITFGSCELKALDAMSIAVTGADLGFRVNGSPQPLWQVINVQTGDTLTWSTAKSGIRSYLAVKGGFQSEPLFNSKSVNVRENIGSQLKNGDLLSCQADTKNRAHRVVPSEFIPDYQQRLTLRVLPSYQFDLFEEPQKEHFLNQRYTVSSASDRTGCRLDGRAMTDVQARMISEGICYGSVEITTEGLPIILLKDSPTMGGYPKIATVFSLDLAKLAQRQSGCEVTFESIDIETAQQKRHEFNAFFAINIR